MTGAYVYIRAERILKKKMGARQDVPNCFRTPIQKFHFEMLIFNFLNRCFKPAPERGMYSLIFKKQKMKSNLKKIFFPLTTSNPNILGPHKNSKF